MLLLTGPSGSGKTHRVLAEFRGAVHARRNDMRLIVPTATLAQHLRHELAREGLVFNPRTIVTLAGFLGEICSDAQPAGNPALMLAAEAAVREVNAREFDRVALMPGFHAALVHSIGELDTAGCTPDQFARAYLDAPLARPLLAVWRNMERQLAARSLLTRSQLLRRVIAKVRAWRAEDGPGRIWFDGFVGFPRPELELIEALAAKADVTVALPSIETAAPALADLRAAGFDFEALAGIEDPDEDTAPEAAWFQAENLEREADEVARRILLYRDAGRDFRDIAVVLRSPEDLAPLLQTTFERFGIPARFYFSAPLSEHPLAAFASRLIDAALSGWDLKASLSALRLLPGEAPAVIDCWDVALRERIPGQGLDTLREIGVRAVDRFAALDGWRSARWSADRWADVLAELPLRFASPRPLDQVSWGEAQNERTRASATGVWAEAMEAARRWFAPSTPFLTLEEFWRVANTVVAQTPLEAPDARRNVVHVMSVFEARQWNPAVMFVPNLIEKVFPRYHPQDPFLPDSAIRELQRVGVRLRDSRDRDREEACLFDSLVQRHAKTRREICLSYPRRNARGDENLRSSFFGHLRAVESQPLAVRPRPLAASLLMRPAAPIRNADLLASISARQRHFSPSGLEAYARCPFQFFADRTLRLVSLPDTPEDRLSFLVQGNIVHDVLKQWTPVRGEVRPHFDAVFAAVCEREHIQQTYRTEVLRRRMLADLEDFCSTFRTYSDRTSMPEQSFEFELIPGVRLRGRIDRVDPTDDGGAIIVDYKYSNNTKQNVQDESKLQGVLYTIAAERALGLQPRATVFIGLRRDNRPVGWGDLPGHDLPPITAEWLEKGVTTVERLVHEIREGVVQPAPSNLRHCQYCDARDACRYESTEAVRTV
jgi:ATP-dependent helicase/DNAse subunit B